MARVYIAIGSNLGDRKKNIDDAIALLNRSKAVRIEKVSSIYETKPEGGPRQGDYLNGVIEIATALQPVRLLKVLNEIELKLGRERKENCGPRTMDLDILLYDDIRMKTKELIIPHPRMFKREFVMRGLGEIAPEIHENNYRD